MKETNRIKWNSLLKGSAPFYRQMDQKVRERTPAGHTATPLPGSSFLSVSLSAFSFAPALEFSFSSD